MKIHLTTKKAQIFTVLVLTGILSVGNGLTLLKSATATPTDLLPANKNEVLERSFAKNRLPQPVADAVLQAASQRLNLPTNQLSIIQYIQRTWRDGCLELSKPDEVCTQTLVNGWRVEVVAVDQTLVYHTNDSGSAIGLNEKASEISESDRNTIKPVPIPTTELPPPIDSGVIFQQISSGGFAGRTEKTVLMDDGRLIRVGLGDRNNSQQSDRRISHKQLRQFQQLLEKEKFTEFKNLSYPAPLGAADSITYTLTSRDGTVEYNDSSQSSLPENLQVVVRAWNRISRHVGAGSLLSASSKI